MEVSYQHANPHDGRESYLVRVRDDVRDQTTCVLVDAGAGVDVDDLLDDEYLSAICVTHPHLDHVRTLGENLRDGAPVYATPETASAIEARLDAGTDHVDLANGDDLREAFEPIAGWTRVTSDVRVHPVPAGHAPGASGFVVEFADGSDRYRLLATGDWTTRRAAGYPGLPTDLPVDVVFLTAATAEDFPAQFTDALARIVERARAGSTVLATASGTTGVHLAYLLAHLAARGDAPLPVTVAGRVATLWEAFEYDHPGVESVPTFADPAAVLEPGGVAIAGPEVPVAGSSRALFDAVQDDGGATLVQVTSGAFEPVASAGCTVDDFVLRNHPDEATVDATVEALQPVHVVVTHQQGRAADRYKDKYDSFVWATDDRRRYTLYEDGDWSGPPWVTDATRRRVRSRLYTTEATSPTGGFDAADVPFPSVGRLDDPDLGAEGVDLERLDDALGVGAVDEVAAPAGAGSSTGDAGDGSTTADDGEAPPRAGPSRGVDDADDESFAAVLERLDRIEAAVAGIDTRATVVDAGEGATLLRVLDDAVAAQLDHGATLDVTLRPSEESDAAGDGDDAPSSGDDAPSE